MAHSTAEVISSHYAAPRYPAEESSAGTQSLLPQGYLNSVLHLM